MGRSKYNVDDDTSKRTCNGIVFDSVMEMKYYRDVVLPQVESGGITNFELQKSYELQPKFTHDGQSVRAITYVADFYLEHADGSVVVIDIKGMADSKAVLKRKLFWYNYPDVDYRWITYVKKYGGWVNWDDVQKLRKADRMKRKELEEMKNGEEQEANV